MLRNIDTPLRNVFFCAVSHPNPYSVRKMTLIPKLMGMHSVQRKRSALHLVQSMASFGVFGVGLPPPKTRSRAADPILGGRKHAKSSSHDSLITTTAASIH